MADAAAIVRQGLRVGFDPAAPQLAAEAEALPTWLVSRARCEAERARLLQLAREDLERQLVPRVVAEQAGALVRDQAQLVVGRIPSRLAIACPRLDSEDVAVVAQLLAEALEGLDGVALPAG
ncbi:hypothetical protein KBZ15_10035 [Cyanobium sp. BA20m-p-22]|uniref:hypothetical protein n=1 Tax=Cyanobium sp. BA20m-p-22 TaxID=2823704 RepID=UPI0020CFB115|nr:hypothetical protein [Cyanobium sp. BA20m-p-22]MCP9910242.1 hypothetical protein [Cyanobium sp. BA20m-p-22]